MNYLDIPKEEVIKELTADLTVKLAQMNLIEKISQIEWREEGIRIWFVGEENGET